MRGFRLFVLIFMLPVLNVQAVEPMVQQANNYFNNITTLQAKFRQVDINQGLIQLGTFYLKRPGKFLWQYENPYKHKIISTGSRMFYVDEESAQVTQIPSGAGISDIFMRKEINFSDPDLNPTSITNERKEIVLTFGMGENIEQGNLTLVFSKQPFEITRIIMLSPTSEKTIIEFAHIQKNVLLPKEFFNYIPPQEEDFLYN